MRWAIWWTAILVVGMTMTPDLSAGGFRIETKVFVGKEPAPVSENLTLFTDGVAYDFSLASPREIAILDTKRLKFLLLDPARKVQTEIDCKMLHDFTAELQRVARASTTVSQVHKFAADPQFTESIDRSSNRAVLTLSSGVIDYHVETTRPEKVEYSDLYGTFADWYARLNATHPGALPPFHRLSLNAVLVKHGLVPTRLERTIIDGAKPKLIARSEHVVAWQLTSKDRQQIDLAADYQVKFKSITFAEYRSLAQAMQD